MSFAMPFMMLLMNLVSLLIMWVGGHAIAESTMQVGDMMAYIQYAMQIIMSFLFITMIFIMVPRAMDDGLSRFFVVCTRPRGFRRRSSPTASTTRSSGGVRACGRRWTPGTGATTPNSTGSTDSRPRAAPTCSTRTIRREEHRARRGEARPQLRARPHAALSEFDKWERFLSGQGV